MYFESKTIVIFNQISLKPADSKIFQMDSSFSFSVYSFQFIHFHFHSLLFHYFIQMESNIEEEVKGMGSLDP